ncbi:MAG: tRNA (guanosine(46)-N7)-methyltransferase TrmB [Acidobacteria bacterium]|nr:tRNA (guanosine(46)-N7)-methyltransferase TrmB [Acidobacteriota bacterium]
MRVRVHQHVNPLAPFYRVLPPSFEIENAFAAPDLPLHLDIGTARGRFLLQMAEIERRQNFLGLEIRAPLVAEANRLASEKKLTNLCYQFCNAGFALDDFLENLPAGILQTVTIQFPDPWYKKRHAKRRMVNETLVKAIAEHLKTSGRIFIQSDVDFLSEEMFALFRAPENLREIEQGENPFPVKTERERAVEEKGLPIYRAAFEKTERG